MADDDRLRTVDEHLAIVLDGIGSIDPIELTLLDAQGLLLAEDVARDFPLPELRQLRDGRLRGAGHRHPRRLATTTRSALQVVGDVAAGAKSRSGMGPGLAMRIMTGAPIPAGADAVIPLEDTDRGVARVAIHRPVRTGECVRRAGEDLAAGAPALGAGAALGPQQLALLAAIGRDRVIVRPAAARHHPVDRQRADRGRATRPCFGEVIDSNSLHDRRGREGRRRRRAPHRHRPRRPRQAARHAGEPAAARRHPRHQRRRQHGRLRRREGGAVASSAPSSSPRSRCSRASRRASATSATRCRSSACRATRSAAWCRSRRSSGRRSASCSASAACTAPPSQAIALEGATQPARRAAVPPRRPAPRGQRRVQRLVRRRPGLAPARRRWRCRTAWSCIDEEDTEVVAGSAGHGHAAAAVQPVSAWPRMPGLAGRAVRRAGRCCARRGCATRGRGARSGCATSSWLRRGSRPRRTPGTSATRSARGRRCTRRCGRARGDGTMLPFMIMLRRPARRADERLERRPRRAALVHGRLLGRRGRRRARHHADRARAGDRPLLRRGRPAPRRGRHPAGERGQPARRREARAAAARASTSASSTSTAAWRDHVAFAITVEELGGRSMLSRLPRCRPSRRGAAPR